MIGQLLQCELIVYGYRKVHARLLAQGWTGIGCDQEARIMREPVI